MTADEYQILLRAACDAYFRRLLTASQMHSAQTAMVTKLALEQGLSEDEIRVVSEAEYARLNQQSDAFTTPVNSNSRLN